jgi:hypothetical protein
MLIRAAVLSKLCFCALLLTSAAFAADPALLDLIPADSGVIIGINIEQISSTRFGQIVYSQVQSQLLAQGQDLGALSGAPGMALLRSIRQVLIAAPANKQQKNRGVFLMRGTFDDNTVRALASGAAESNFQGVRIFTKPQQKQPLSIAVLDPTLMLGGDPQNVRAAIARRSLPGSPDPVLTAKARELGASYDLWLVARASLADLAGQSPQPQLGALAGGFEKSIQQIAAGLKFGPTLEVSVDLATRTDKDAAAMADALKMLITMAASGQNAQQMKPVLDNLQLRADGNTVKMNIVVPEDQLMSAMESAAARSGSTRRTGSSEVVIQGSTPPNAASQPQQGGMVVTLPGPNQR